MSDRLLGGIVLLLAIVIVVAASQIKAALVFDPLGPQTFPIVIGIVLGLASLYPILRPDPKPNWPTLGRLGDIALVLVILIAYAQLLRPLGFVLATFLASGLLSWRLGARPLTAIAAGVGIAVGIYAVFHLILGLSLARGPWGF